MKRRRFLSSMGLILPAAVLSTEFLLSSCNQDVKDENSFTEHDISLLNEIAETIIPASTTSPGAKAAKVGEFMNVYVTDCYTPEDQQTFMEGISTVKKLCKSKYSNKFINMTLEQKHELLNTLEKEVSEQATHKRNKEVAADGDA
ncbi:MAG: gluconate 2-dehydrogenase subunit 3 family protein, partial [Ginsengibacter sp.]